MPLAGSYQQLVAFLRAMENFEHFVTVDRVALRDKDGAASLDVEVSAYFRGSPEAKAKGQGT
jgi:Tfp pilus assembly protein PilO